jgi:hypothetical protein
MEDKENQDKTEKIKKDNVVLHPVIIERRKQLAKMIALNEKK